MAKHAYRDKDTKKIIYSSSVMKEDRNTAFVCLNKMCEDLSIDESESAYFRASKA